jgi:hypothetical protein
VKDPDQPEKDDPQRKEYDFLQAKAAQSQMASGSFGNHHSAILPDSANQGESKKGRLESMISDAVKSAVTQITTSIAAMEQVSPPQSTDPRPAEMPDQGRRQAAVDVPPVAPVVVQQQAAVPQVQHAQQPIVVNRESFVEPQSNAAPQFMQLPDSMSPGESQSPPSIEEVTTAKTASRQENPSHYSPLPLIDRLAMPDRPIEEIRTSTRVQAAPQKHAGDQDQPQDPPREPRRVVPQWPQDRAAWGPSEPFMDQGAKTADPQRSAYQTKSTEQSIDFSEAMDSYSIEMVAFAESVADSIRVITRRLNDITRAIQGEGYDIR